MQSNVPLDELVRRMRRFHLLMDERHPDWEIAILFGKIQCYYFTGTMQDGILVIPRGKEACLWVRKSYERAINESLFPEIRPMRSFRDAARTIDPVPPIVYLDAEKVPLALYERLRKHFPFREAVAIDSLILEIRSVKSTYELDRSKQAGEIHRRVLEDLVPGVLRGGMSEADLTGEIFSLMLEEGHHGIVRFGPFDSDVNLGLVAFGESSLCPTYLDSPGGMAGLSPATPFIGSRTRKLTRGDLVFIDIGCGFNGYQTDKTMTYVYGRELPDEAVGIHEACVELQHTIASLLKPGTIPQEIYETVIAGLAPQFLENFMGFRGNKVAFLGHGVGLEISETPVIARGFARPLEEGMTIAVEPKCGIAGIGMVGIENTFLVTPSGGKSLTGDHPGLLFVRE